MLEILAHLDLDTGPHIVTTDNVHDRVERESTPVPFGYFQCQECGARFGDPTIRLDRQIAAAHAAAVHQAGDDLVTVAQFNGGDLDGYVWAMARRSPERWASWIGPGRPLSYTE